MANNIKKATLESSVMNVTTDNRIKNDTTTANDEFDAGLLPLVDFEYGEINQEPDAEFLQSMKLFGFSDAFLRELNVQRAIYNYQTFATVMLSCMDYFNVVDAHKWFEFFGYKSFARYIQEHIKCMCLYVFLKKNPPKVPEGKNILVLCYRLQYAEFVSFYYKQRQNYHNQLLKCILYIQNAKGEYQSVNYWQIRLAGKGKETIRMGKPMETPSNHTVIDVCIVWDSESKSFPRINAAIQAHLLQIGMEYCFDRNLIAYYDIKGGLEGIIFPIEKYPDLTRDELRRGIRIMHGILLSVFFGTAAQPILEKYSESLDGLRCYQEIVTTHGGAK